MEDVEAAAVVVVVPEAVAVLADVATLVDEAAAVVEESAAVVYEAAATARGARTVIASWVKRILLISMTGSARRTGKSPLVKTH